MSERGVITLDEPPREVAPVTPMDMLQMAVEKGADIEKLQQLMALQERWEANNARKAFVAAMAEFKADPPAILKNRTVSYGNGKAAYDHATLDQVCDAVGTALAKYGLAHSWGVEQEGDVIRVSCVLTHALGHSERVTMSAKPDTSGSKNPIQAIGSATTYLQRYTLLSATGLAAKGQDDDSGHVDTITAEQKERLIERMREVGASTGPFLQYLGVNALDSLPGSRFDHAMAALDKKASKENDNG